MPLHPALKRLLDDYRETGRPALSSGSPVDTRTLIATGTAALGAGPAVGSVTELVLSGRNGSIPARLYQPNLRANGLLVYLHGGGWVAGGLDDFDTFSRHLCARSGWSVLLPDYRLAPEHPFPAAIEDAEDAVRWASRQCAAQIPPALPLGIGGDSAGGNLATVTAAALRTELTLALQVLIYPVTDCAMDTPSYAAYGNDLTLTAADMHWFFSHYAPQTLWHDPRISPLRNPALAGMPATWLATAEYDVLHDEGRAYAHALMEAGVSVHFEIYAGMTHGFARMMNFIDTADRMIDDVALALRHASATL